MTHRTVRPEYLHGSLALSRRQFIAAGSTALLGGGSGVSAADTSALIASTETITLRRGGVGSGPTWFHPRCCVVPSGPDSGPIVLMTLQAIAGSDYFGPVHWMATRIWAQPGPNPNLWQRSVE